MEFLLDKFRYDFPYVASGPRKIKLNDRFKNNIEDLRFYLPFAISLISSKDTWWTHRYESKSIPDN